MASITALSKSIEIIKNTLVKDGFNVELNIIKMESKLFQSYVQLIIEKEDLYYECKFYSNGYYIPYKDCYCGESIKNMKNDFFEEFNKYREIYKV